MKPLDVLAIGDTAVDAFIRLKDARTHCTIDDERCELCLRFADKVPYESVTIIPGVGNAANAAVSSARLGLSSGFLGAVGIDENGKACMDALAREKVDVSLISRQEGAHTNYHYVLWYEAERTILVKHQAFSYTLPPLTPPRFIYLSSLAEESLSYHDEIAAYVAAHQETQLVFQPGTFQMKLGVERLRELYRHTALFFCNKDEAKRILATEETDVRKLLEELRRLGPRIAVITDARKGAFALSDEGAWKVPMYPDPKPPLERTGAGDAFASTFTAALALGKNVPEALAWGPINSMSVVQYVGAREGLLSREGLEDLLQKAPSDYRVTTL